ncbi:hypothetical protein [Myxosarcina sp. GI1]|uniref:hypothetical protein n=1 Tax=Myxosarcina sp. GI1 TaxID=1541065 RepID=UPI000566D098|nr:hypothetical protein [Myxosarcina sp. GI1]
MRNTNGYERHHFKPIRTNLYRLAGAVTGGILAYIIGSNLQLLLSAILCSMAIAFSAYASTRLHKPFFWWLSVAAIAGSVVGTGSVLADYLKVQTNVTHTIETRVTMVGFLAIAGIVSGFFLGSSSNKARSGIPHPKEFIKSVSGLTAGVFAAIVTISFIFQGLEEARTLSSRLSATTTILATSLAIPGWGGYLTGHFIYLLRNKTSRHRRIK